MPIYLVNLDVQLKQPIDLERDDGSIEEGAVEGFILEIGATTPDEPSLKTLVAETVTGDSDIEASNVDLVFERIVEIAPEKVPLLIYGDDEIAPALLSGPLQNGLWFRSERGFYWDC